MLEEKPILLNIAAIRKTGKKFPRHIRADVMGIYITLLGCAAHEGGIPNRDEEFLRRLGDHPDNSRAWKCGGRKALSIGEVRGDRWFPAFTHYAFGE